MVQVYNPFNSVIDVVNHLHNRGFVIDFSYIDNRLFCAQTKSFFTPEQFEILEVFSFDDDSYHALTVVYAIECCGNIKGILIRSISQMAYEQPNTLVLKLQKFWR